MGDSGTAKRMPCETALFSSVNRLREKFAIAKAANMDRNKATIVPRTILIGCGLGDCQNPHQAQQRIIRKWKYAKKPEYPTDHRLRKECNTGEDVAIGRVGGQV